MRHLATKKIVAVVAAAIAGPCLAHASSKCGDFLSTLAKKPALLDFVDCKPGKQNQLRVLVATYRVKGEHASQVESHFNRLARMPKLRFYCCGWELNVSSTPRYGLLSSQQKTEYEITMESEETLFSVRTKWNHIKWFYVLVTLPLEEA